LELPDATGLLQLCLNFFSLLGLPLGVFLPAIWPGAPELRPGRSEGILHFPIGMAVMLAFGLALAWLCCSDRREWLRDTLPWLALSAWGLLYSGAVAVHWSGMSPGTGIHPTYLSFYSTTTLVFSVATIQLVGVVGAVGGARVLRPTAFAAACLVACLVGNYAQTAPELIRQRAEGRAERHCFDLAQYLAPLNSCFWAGPNPINRAHYVELLERNGFRRTRRDLRVVHAPDPRAGVLESVTRLENGAWQATGWARIEAGRFPDAVVIGFARGEQPLSIVAQRLEREELDGSLRVRFRAHFPASLFEPGLMLRAWRYDAEAARLQALSGEWTRPRGS
jgi:hypothetical protein